MRMPNGPHSSGEQNWWMSRGGEVYGPYDYQTVLFCRQDGRIVDDDYVKCGEEPWRRAAEAVPVSEGAAPTAVATSPPRPSKPSSQKWIIIAVVAGAAFMLLAALAIFAAILFPVFGRAKEKAQATVCLSNVKQLGVALMMYTTDYEERLPEADSWEEAVAPYIMNAEILACPVTGKHYVFNKKLSGMDLKGLDNPQETPMLWEPARDAEGLVGPHGGRFNVGYVDGHAQMVDELPTAN